MARAIAMRGVELTGMATGTDITAAIARLDAVPPVVYRVGEGRPHRVPAMLWPGRADGLPGLIQHDPPDRIDGWVRLLLIGLMRLRPGWDGVAWVVGPELSHWVHLSADEAVSCQSFLTPRLRRTLGGGLPPCAGAVSDSLSRPERLAAHLRVAELRGDPLAISGHLLGAELAAARPFWLGQTVSLIASDGAGAGHAAALQGQGVPVTVFDAETLLPQACAAVAERIGQAGRGTKPQAL